MFFDQQSLLQQQLEIEDRLYEEKKNDVNLLRSNQETSSPTKRNLVAGNMNIDKNNSLHKALITEKNLTKEIEENGKREKEKDEQERSLNIEAQPKKQSGSEMGAEKEREKIILEKFIANSLKAEKVGKKKEIQQKKEQVVSHNRSSKKRRLEEQKKEQKRIQEERKKRFELQLKLEREREKEQSFKGPISMANSQDSDCTDEYATDDEELNGDFSTEDELESESEDVDRHNSNFMITPVSNHAEVLGPQLLMKTGTILQASSNSFEEEEDQQRYLPQVEKDLFNTNAKKKKPYLMNQLKQKEDHVTIEKYKEIIKRQKLAIFNKDCEKDSNTAALVLSTPANKELAKQMSVEDKDGLAESKNIISHNGNSDVSKNKRDDTEKSEDSLDNKSPLFKVPKINLLQNVSLKRTHDGQIQPPSLKRTRSIDGAKLRSITNIIPLQQKQERIIKNVVKEEAHPTQKKSEQISLLNSVALAKKEKLQKKAIANKVSITNTHAPTVPSTKVSGSAKTGGVTNGSSSSNSLDSEKWKNSWRAVMAESKLITILRDPEMAISSDEERLLSVVQAGFRSLGASLTNTLDSKTFILVAVGNLSESKNYVNVLKLAERMNCKIWNMQKAKRFFNHLDINVDEMEKEFDTMRFIDYAKYKISVNFKLLEQTKQQGAATLSNTRSQQTNNVFPTGNNSTLTANNGGKLTEYLNMESKYGHLDRDTSAKREDHHYFSDEKPHLYIYFNSQQFAPVVSMEWKCPVSEEEVYKDKTDLDSLPYPTIKYSYNGRSPFIKRDKEEIAYQRSYELNKARTAQEMEDCLNNGHQISKNLIKQRFEKDLAKQDYALLLKRLYSQTSTPSPENDIYILDKYYATKAKMWVPYNNTLLRADPLEYDERRNSSILNAHQHQIDLQEQINTTANATTAISQNQILKPITPPNENTTNHEDTLTQQTQNKYKEIKASGVFIPTNTGTGTGTGNGLAPVKATVVSTQMKLLQKRQIQQQQRKAVNEMGRSGYCEGCRTKYDNLEKHVKGDKHRSYALSKENFSGIDALIAKITE